MPPHAEMRTVTTPTVPSPIRPTWTLAAPARASRREIRPPSLSVVVTIYRPPKRGATDTRSVRKLDPSPGRINDSTHSGLPFTFYQRATGWRGNLLIPTYMRFRVKSSWSHKPASLRPYGACRTNPTGPNTGSFGGHFCRGEPIHEHSVEALAAHGADEPLGQRIRTRGPDWRFADPD